MKGICWVISLISSRIIQNCESNMYIVFFLLKSQILIESLLKFLAS